MELFFFVYLTLFLTWTPTTLYSPLIQFQAATSVWLTGPSWSVGKPAFTTSCKASVSKRRAEYSISLLRGEALKLLFCCWVEQAINFGTTL